MADYFTQFSCLFDVKTAENAARAKEIYQETSDDLDKNCESIGFEVEASPEDGPGTLWISSGECGEPGQVIAFVMACAEAFDLTGHWGFEYASSCSKPRLDAFSGGAAFIDLGARRETDWVNTGAWLDEKAAQHEEPANAAITALNLVSAGRGWADPKKISLLLKFIDQEIAGSPAERLQAFLDAEANRPTVMDAAAS